MYPGPSLAQSFMRNRWSKVPVPMGMYGSFDVTKLSVYHREFRLSLLITRLKSVRRGRVVPIIVLFEEMRDRITTKAGIEPVGNRCRQAQRT